MWFKGRSNKLRGWALWLPFLKYKARSSTETKEADVGTDSFNHRAPIPKPAGAKGDTMDAAPSSFSASSSLSSFFFRLSSSPSSYFLSSFFGTQDPNTLLFGWNLCWVC